MKKKVINLGVGKIWEGFAGGYLGMEGQEEKREAVQEQLYFYKIIFLKKNTTKIS